MCQAMDPKPKEQVPQLPLLDFFYRFLEIYFFIIFIRFLTVVLLLSIDSLTDAFEKEVEKEAGPWWQ